MKLKMACAVFAATAVCMSGWDFSSGQETVPSSEAVATPDASPTSPRGSFRNGDDDDVQTYGGLRGGIAPGMYGMTGSPFQQTDSAIQQAVGKYRAAEDDKGKDEAKQAMSAALSEYFDADMKLREEEIRDIEERVKKLQAQLERRREAKSKLVELQLQLLVNEAEGLGFYGRSGFDGPFRFGRGDFGGGRSSMMTPGSSQPVLPTRPATPPPPSR